MKITNYNLEGKELNQVELNNELFVKNVNKQAIFDSILAENAGERQGTHSTLTKAEVRGGGRKPYRQKHTGNARQGSIRNPHYVGGGIVFGPKPTRNYKLKVNAKVSKLAFQSAFTLKSKNIIGLNDELTSPKTKKAMSFLKSMKLDNNKTLLITPSKMNAEANNVALSFKNIKKSVVKSVSSISVRDIIHADTLIFFANSCTEMKGVK